MSCEFPIETRLRPGQALCIAIDRGQALRVAEGRVSVFCAPAWIGGTVLRVRTELEEGEVFVSERDGWIEVAAQARPAVVRMLPLAVSPVRSGARSWLLRLWRLLLRRPAANVPGRAG